jgi:tRNA(Ile)-lysidine synthase
MTEIILELEINNILKKEVLFDSHNCTNDINNTNSTTANISILELLKQSKNLLAFSGGIDSTALFFLLKNMNINFDIAIIDYNLRKQAKQEIKYAKKIAKKYNRQIYIKNFDNSSKTFGQQIGREFRYKFFESIINKYKYNNLILAHQLDDKLEWFLMQLSKGAGVFESSNINLKTKTNYGYLLRPLINTPKSKLQNYLKTNSIKYFVDESNKNDKYKRNYFRKHFNSFLFASSYEQGLNKSFAYFNKDFNSILKHKLNKPLFLFKDKNQLDSEFVIYKKFSDNSLNIRLIDIELKKRKIIISSKMRYEIIKQKQIIINNICICIDNTYLWVSPMLKQASIVMDKKYKEKCRLNKIPKKLRTYIYTHKNLLDLIIHNLTYYNKK